MRRLLAPCLLLTIGAGCQTQDANRGDDKLQQAVASLADSLKARDADIATKDLKIAAIEGDLLDRRALIERLNLRLEALTSGESEKADRIKALQVQLEGANGLLGKFEADMRVFVRQLEVQLSQVSELTNKVEEHRAKLAKTLNQKSLLAAELQYAREWIEKLEKQRPDKKDY